MSVTNHVLAHKLKEIKHRLFPLSTHPAAAQEADVRNGYALLLAATLHASQSPGAEQTFLLHSLLSAIGIERDPALLLNAGRQLSGDELFIHLQRLHQAGLGETLLVDALILARVASPLVADQLQLFSELAQALRVQEEGLTRLVEWVQLLLFNQAEFTRPLLLQQVEHIYKDPLREGLYISMFSFEFPVEDIFVQDRQVIKKGSAVVVYSNQKKKECLIEQGMVLMPASEKGDIFIIELPTALLAWRALIDVGTLLGQINMMKRI